MNSELHHRLLTRNVDSTLPEGELEKLLESGKNLRVKLGIDPTGPMIHLGHAVILWKLREFQDLGHQIVLIIGDFTARIGDPSDKDGRRPVLTNSEIQNNLASYKKQLGMILDLRKVEFRRNSEWSESLGIDDLLQLMQNFTVNQMLARRNFAQRYKAEQSIGLDEFLYPLMQGYDSVAIQSDVELGGTDQLFNLEAGRILQVAYKQPPQSILMCTMLLGTDGEKMSKTAGNTIAINEPPVEMFGKVMRIDDSMIDDYLVMTTDATQEEIENIMTEENPRDAKLRLAEKIVERYHGAAVARMAREGFISTFSKKSGPAEMTPLEVAHKEMTVVDLLLATNTVKSKSEAKKIIQQGGLKVDGKTINDFNKKITPKQGTQLQKGKHLFFEAA